jgi:penicillin-binding protein 1B
MGIITADPPELLSEEIQTDQVPRSVEPREDKWRRRRMVAERYGAIFFLIAVSAAGSSYIYLSRRIDKRLASNAFANAENIYAEPLTIFKDDGWTPADLSSDLDAAGYRKGVWAAPKTYRLTASGMEISPAEAGAFPVTITFANDRIARIQQGGKDLAQCNLGNPLIVVLAANNETRSPVSFEQIPRVLVNAVISVEDKHFFHHRGIDFPRIIKAAFVDARSGRKAQGASTLTMQLVRGLWLDHDKIWSRKLTEAAMAIHLEDRWSKDKIFETYANYVYLGHEAAYSIHGFREGARLFFGKELRDITLPEAALLAGMVKAPSHYNPFRSPEDARSRRDVVLNLMKENGYITQDQFDSARSAPIVVKHGTATESRAPWFLDVVNDALQKRDADSSASRDVYTTIDLNLQRAAEKAVAEDMQRVDALTKKSGKKAEAALLALDPSTGEIKAWVGGRDYGRSQVDHILSKRPPGSVFKPFVYAAALETSLSGGAHVYTPASTIDDSPLTIHTGGKDWSPKNFHDEAFGMLTLREALAKSDNVVAIKLAQSVGLGKVVNMARRAGLNDHIAATPAIALGTYDVTPLEMAGAYAIFANNGTWVKPRVLTDVHGGSPDSHAAIDPRLAWMMVNMLQEVMRSGTAAGVRSRGFTLPAAGKTGTSHDGWFAGFTSRLLCIVWVGFDDYTDLNLEGAKSALPIWTDFMKAAARVKPYRDARDFPIPAGIEQQKICLQSGELAGDLCPDVRSEYFISGSAPTRKCDMHIAAQEAIPQPPAYDLTPIDLMPAER